jgi:hypothetical protein
MKDIRTLPDGVALQYTELMQQCIKPAPDGANLSFKSKTIGKKRYWYLYISLGNRRTEHYLGEESTALLDTIDDEKALWASTEDDRSVRARLVAMLLAGGATGIPTREGKVLALLERSGVFLAGGVVVGTLAFRAYANMLGVIWHNELQTRDIDVATDNQFPIAIPQKRKPIQLADILLNSRMGFLEVPAFDRKSPSTKFKIRGEELSVELLTPMRGRETSRPVEITWLGAFAEPLQFIDYLMDDIQAAVLLYKHGILINVPAPGRFAFHKLVVSQRRRIGDHEKIKRDLAQAEQLFSVLVDGRPGDLILAYEAAEKMGEKFQAHLRAGLALIDPEIYQLIKNVVGT